MSGTVYTLDGVASTSQIPTLNAPAQSFAARARAKKAQLEAQSRLAPPPGFSTPGTTSLSSRGRSRVPSPSFYGQHDSRERRHGGNKILLPITPSLTPSSAIISPSTPSPIPRTPSPPPITEASSFYRHSLSNSNSSRGTINDAINCPLPSSSSAGVSSANLSDAKEKRQRNGIGKKSSAQPSLSNSGMRTGSTTSANVSTASFTTSTSASHLDKSYGHSTSVFGVSMPPSSYTYGARSVSGSAGRPAPRMIAPPPGLPGIPTAGNVMQRSRSGSGTRTAPLFNRLSVSASNGQAANVTSRDNMLPPPLTIPAATAENSNTSPSTVNCGSPGMFSYTSTPTSSSTNPSSVFQSPGYTPPSQHVRTGSPTRPLIPKYTGTATMYESQGKSNLGPTALPKRKESTGNGEETMKQSKVPTRATRESLTSVSSSTLKPKDLKAAVGEAVIPKLPQPSKHTRKSSKDLLPSKSAITAGFAGFHFRKSSKDLNSSNVPTSQFGRSSHSRQSSRDSSRVQSPGDSSTTSASYFPSMTSPIPIPVPSISSRTPPSRPSRDGASDDLEGFTADIPIIQSGIVSNKDSKIKGPKMKIVTSSSLPQRAGLPFGNAAGSSSSLNLASTSVPGRSKTFQTPTPTSATGANVVRGFNSSTSTVAAVPSKQVEASPRKLKKEDRKGSIDKTITALPPPLRPSLFSSRSRTKPTAGPPIKADKEKAVITKRGPGPAAGTGHEGYAQFTRAPRSRSSSGSAIPTGPVKASSSSSTLAGSTTGSGSLGRSAGSAAIKTGEIDDFLSSRLEPVVIKNGIIKPGSVGSTEMNRTISSQSNQSNQSLLPQKAVDSQKSSLDMSRSDSTPGLGSRNQSLDLPRKNGNAFDQFDFGTNVTGTRRPSLAVDTFQSRISPAIESANSRTTLPNSGRTVPGKLTKPVTLRTEEREGSKLKPPKKLVAPAINSPGSQPARRWNIFGRSQSAPNVAQDTRTKNVPPKTAPQSPVFAQEVRFGDENEGGYIRDVHSPPAIAPVQETAVEYSGRKQPHVQSILLPDPPVMPITLVSRTPSPVTAVQLSHAGIPITVIPITKGTSSNGYVRPPPGLPVPANLQPFISITSSTPTKPVPNTRLPDIVNSSPVSALSVSPVSVSSKSVSPKNHLIRPTPANLPVRNIQELAESNFKQYRKTSNASVDPTWPEEGEEEDDDDDDDDELYTDDEVEENLETSAEVALSDRNLMSNPAVSQPVTPKSVTPEPNVNPSPGRRQRLEAFVVGRIPTPKAKNVESSNIKIPTLADILPPPPVLPTRQPLQIHPPRRIEHSQQTMLYSPSSEGEDDSTEEETDYINTRNIPLATLAPLITSGWSQILPGPKRVSAHSDDWQEYDDFLDEMSGTPRSKTSSLGSPFPYSRLSSKFKQDIEDEIKESESNTRLRDSPTLPSVATFPGPVLKFPQSNKKKLVLDKNRLALGRPLAARPLLSPGMPTARTSLFSPGLKDLDSQRSSSTYSMQSTGNPRTIAFADFIAAYAEVDTGVMSVIDPLNNLAGTPSTARKLGLLSPMSSMTDFEDTESEDSDSVRQSIISVMPGSEDALEGEMKVRLWALMTSRWLSFGRVLVSPAHEEIRSGGTGNRILVVDGLGNDDWSFYCSLNYLNANVYNLTPSQTPSPMSPGGKSIPMTSSGDNLTNHFQIHHASFASPFPFPSGFFSVVSFRFLPPAADALWPFIISQCMRVLRPGGHIELSVLDIDMVNMGPRTKRTINKVKVNLRNHQAGNGSDWSKKSPSEKALRLMAKKGFTSITRCRVGLPTVGNVDGSREERASMQQILREGNAPDEVDMSNAEGINRVVSKVGRWWYSKCFENLEEDGDATSLHGKSSLWDDKTLLRECEKKKTNFRMLISFAQKPVDWKD